MKVLGIVLAIVFTTAWIAQAWACPPGSRYQCYQGYNGKVVCSCS